MKIWVCEECGSSDIEVLIWVKVNGFDYVSDEVPNKYYCNGCKDFVEYIGEKEDENT